MSCEPSLGRIKNVYLLYHYNVLSFVEPKNTNKVSLTPQRRSFGSGCSWREAVTGKINNTGGTSTVDSPEEESNDDVFVNTPSGQPHHVHPSSPHGYSMYQHGTHPPPPRIIDHVPYRSRHSEWSDYRQPNRGSWRGKENFGKEVRQTVSVYLCVRVLVTYVYL